LLRHIADALLAFGPLGVFLLSLLDSFGVPLPAAIDALLLFVAWKTPDRAWITAFLAIAGSLVGNIGLFLAARGGGRRWVNAIPEPGQPQRFRMWFLRYGLITVFIPALFPIPLPLKVFVISDSRWYSTSLCGWPACGGTLQYSKRALRSRASITQACRSESL
jgi:membrane protein DedA with SNARE-associated domain